MAKPKNSEVMINRRCKQDERRATTERRSQEAPVASERRISERRKVPRRRQIDPTTCEREYSIEEVEFMHALDAYKRANGRMFPTCSEILEVVRGLGYVKQAAPIAIANDSLATAMEPAPATIPNTLIPSTMTNA